MFTSHHWRRLIDAAPDALVVVDAHGSIVYASSRVNESFGYRPQELIGKPIEVLIPERYRAGHNQNVLDFVNDPSIRPMGEHPMLSGRRKDGSEFPAQINLSPVEFNDQTHVVAAVRNISELEDARNEIAQHSIGLRELIDAIPDAVGVHRGRELVYANTSLARMLGYAEVDELIGESILSLMREDHHEAVERSLDYMAHTGELVPPGEVQFYRRDGSLMTVEMHTRPMVFDGQPAFVAIGRDASHKKRRLARTMRRDRKAAVGTLASGVAHEVNNPLAFAKSSIEFVVDALSDRSDPNDPDEHDELLDALADAREGLERIARIVSDLDTFADRHGQDTVLLDLEDVLEAAISVVFGRIETNAHLIRSLRAVPRVRANRAKLAEVFVNLLTNAILAIEESSKEPNELRITTYCVDNRVYVEIEDSGCGIPDEQLPHIFDPFFTSRAGGEGTGLGLTIAQNVIEKLGGDIDIVSQPGEGTTVTMWLAAAEPCGPCQPGDLDTESEELSADLDAPTQEVDLSH